MVVVLVVVLAIVVVIVTATTIKIAPSQVMSLLVKPYLVLDAYSECFR